MLIDTHCHINSMVKQHYTNLMQESDIPAAEKIITQAQDAGVSPLINIGASHVDNYDNILLAQRCDSIFITVGLHPNDGSSEWQTNIQQIKQWLRNKESHKIVGVGECGLDMHYPDYNLSRQRDMFKTQIELALEHDLALVVHSRDAYDETLSMLEQYKNDIKRAVMHCFSYDQPFADLVIAWNFVLGIGGTVTYPKNNTLRDIVKNIPLEYIVLETDAPFLPPQSMRGKQNHPQYITLIAEYIAQLRGESFNHIAQQTTHNAQKLFGL